MQENSCLKKRYTTSLYFLFEMAKELETKDSMLMLAGRAKGNEPLVFQDGGKTYRAFLEGRTKDQSYIL